MTDITLTTRVAHARFSDHYFCGHGALTELLGSESYMGLVALAAGGTRLSLEEKSLLDDFAVSMAAADPRIWPLKITRLVASYGGTLAGYAAGQLCIEGTTIGPWVAGAAAELLLDVKAETAGATTEGDVTDAMRRVVLRASRLPGYGVAFRPQDERVNALRAHLAVRGRTELPFWTLQEMLSEVIRQEKRLEPNMGVAAAALLLDMGFSPHQAAVVTTFANQNTFIANAVEGATQAAPCLRRLPNDRIDYVGRGPRDTAAASKGPKGN